MIELGPEHEGPHEIGPEELWQESVVLVWWDQNNGVGGMHRIGHEPNVSTGPQISLWNHIFSPKWAHKRTVTLPLREEDRPENGFGGGDDGCRFEYTDHAIWTINEPDVKAELRIKDSHSPIDIYPKKGGLGEDFAPNHMEVGGTVTGRLSIKGEEYDINGLAFRDHGWGLRDWSALTSHRWVAGVFDEKLSFFASVFHSSDDQIVGFGCLVENGEIIYSSDACVLPFMEADGLSHRGGIVQMTLTNGKSVEIECTPFQKGAMSWIHGIACVDTMCEARMGDKVGICDFEITNNALRGSHVPQVAINAILENDIHPVE